MNFVKNIGTNNTCSIIQYYTFTLAKIKEEKCTFIYKPLRSVKSLKHKNIKFSRCTFEFMYESVLIYGKT